MHLFCGRKNFLDISLFNIWHKDSFICQILFQDNNDKMLLIYDYHGFEVKWKMNLFFEKPMLVETKSFPLSRMGCLWTVLKYFTLIGIFRILSDSSNRKPNEKHKDQRPACTIGSLCQEHMSRPGRCSQTHRAALARAVWGWKFSASLYRLNILKWVFV